MSPLTAGGHAAGASRTGTSRPASGRDDGAGVVAREAEAIAAAIRTAADWLASAPAAGAGGAGMAARRLRDEGLAPSLQIDEPLPWVSDGSGGGNVPLTALALQIRYLRASARLSYAAVRWLLCEVIGEDPVPWAGVVESRCGTEEDPGAAVAAVNAAAALLAASARAGAGPLFTPPRGPSCSRLSGEAHLSGVADVVRRSLGDADADAHTHAGQLGTLAPPARGYVIAEQCVLARRYGEAVMPALSARLRPAIRRRLAGYHRELDRHRAQEELACDAAGVDARELDGWLPLPWFQVLVDAFLAVAQADTGAFLAAVTVAGDPCDPFGIRRRLGADGAPGAAPAAVPDLARSLLSEIPSVTAFRHRRVVETVLLLAEMAERARRSLVDRVVDPAPAAWLPPPYGAPPRAPGDPRPAGTARCE